MNHCLLEVQVKQAPTIRYTQDNKTPIAEMEVLFAGLRPDDSPGELKVVGWGGMAQELQNKVQVGQKIVLEGRLRINTVPRQDGTKEKRAELTLSKLHDFSSESKDQKNNNNFPNPNKTQNTSVKNPSPEKTFQSGPEEQVNWNSAPLVPDTDDIPF